MKLLQLDIENFMSFAGRQSLDLDGLGLALISGINEDDFAADSSNGAGKSTLLEAATWCLFGEGLPRPQGNSDQGIRGDESLNDKIGKQCRVKALLQDETATYEVSRWRKWKASRGKRTNGVQLAVNGIAKEALDEKETNRQIEQAIGITRDIWCRGVVFGQESSFDFCDATSKERQALLSTVMGLEAIDIWQEKCREEKRGLSNDLAGLQGKIEILQSQLAQLEQENPAELAGQWEIGHQNQLADLAQLSENIIQEGQSLAAALGALTGPSELPEVQLPQIPIELENAKTEASQARQQALYDLNRARDQLQRLSTSLSQVQQLQGTCPTCKQSITKEHILSCSEVITAEATALQVAIGTLGAAEQEAIRRSIAVDTAIQAAKDRTNQQLQEQVIARKNREQILRERSRLEKDIEVARQRWRNIECQRQEVKDEKNPYIQIVEQYQGKLERTKAELDKLRSKQAQLSQQKDICDWWDKELPRFRVWLFDTIVDLLAAEANKYLGIMSQGTIWIQISTQKEVNKRTRDEIDIQVFRWNPDRSVLSRPYRVWSGGEKRRISLAVDLGLSRLLASRASSAYRMIALDEIDRHLDEPGREGLRLVLEALKNEKDTILVVSHSNEFKASFDRKIEVRKKNGYSQISMASTKKS